MAISDQTSKIMDLADRLDDSDPALRKAEELEKRRNMLSHEIDLREQEHPTTSVFSNISKDHIRKILRQHEERLNQGNSEATKEKLNLIQHQRLPSDLELRWRPRGDD